MKMHKALYEISAELKQKDREIEHLTDLIRAKDSHIARIEKAVKANILLKKQVKYLKKHVSFEKRQALNFIGYEGERADELEQS